MNFFKKSIITRGDNQPYLVRWNIFECKAFSLKLHKFLCSDDDCLHCHPWRFITFLFHRGYHEVYEDFKGDKVRHYIPRWSVKFRNATYKHKVVLERDLKGKERPTYTLLLTFKKVRTWGFWNSQGFTAWFNYKSTGRRCD